MIAVDLKRLNFNNILNDEPIEKSPSFQNINNDGANRLHVEDRERYG